MISTDQWKQIFEELTEISGREFLLFSAEGEPLAQDPPDESYAETVRLFASSDEETIRAEGWIGLREEVHGRTEYVLLVSESGEPEQSLVIGKMALAQIRNLLMADLNPQDKTDTLRQILQGELTGERAEERSRRLKPYTDKSAVFVVRHEDGSDSFLVETLTNLFVTSPVDFVVEMDDSTAVLIKDTAELSGMDLEQYARTIADNLQTEAMTDVRIGYGDPVDSAAQFAEAYRNACTALRVGSIFQAEERVYYYQKLGIGRLIYKLPQDLCEMFLREVLGDQMELDLDEQMTGTIRKFFENNLNISETARQLYIHRNTLIYRLDRIEQKLGLDIRSFEDAMLLRIAMMVRMHLNELKL